MGVLCNWVNGCIALTLGKQREESLKAFTKNKNGALTLEELHFTTSGYPIR